MRSNTPRHTGETRHQTPRVRLGKTLKMRALLLVLSVGLIVGCAEISPNELIFIRDDQREVSAPGIIGAKANGRGCASTKGDALEQAKRSAWYNLRSVTGHARYTITYTITNFVPSVPPAQDYFCYEVVAESVGVR